MQRSRESGPEIGNASFLFEFRPEVLVFGLWEMHDDLPACVLEKCDIT